MTNFQNTNRFSAMALQVAGTIQSALAGLKICIHYAAYQGIVSMKIKAEPSVGNIAYLKRGQRWCLPKQLHDFSNGSDECHLLYFYSIRKDVKKYKKMEVLETT